MIRQESGRVLVVDDEERIRQAVHRVLSEAGYEVFLACDGMEGLARVESDLPDLVLVDLMMPVMDGMEFLEQARRRFPDLTTVVITGFATVEKAVEAMKQGADDFLAKPFKPNDLRVVVARAFSRVRTLQDISIEKSRYRTLVAAMRNGVLVVDTAGRIVLANPGLATLLGVEPGALQGALCRQALPWPEVQACLEAALAGGAPVPREARPQVSLGQGERAVHLQVDCAAFHDNRGRVVGAVAVFDDVTAFTRMGQMKNEFVSTVAHEIVSPLSAVLGQLQNLSQGLLGPLEEGQKALLARASRRLMSIVNLSGDLLDLSKIEAGVMGPAGRVDLPELVREAVDQVQPRAMEKGQDLTLDIQEGLPPVTGVAQELLRMLVNLVGNAVKYTPDQGSIKVSASAERDRVVLKVVDNGLGIPPEEQEAVFQRFHRVKNADTRDIPGTGLGLSIVARVVESHDGRLELVSAPRQGSTFTVSLPAAGD